jgi:hypothetical protein
MTETFHINSKNGTKRNNFHLISNLGVFWIFRLNFGQNVSISFYMFRNDINFLKLDLSLIYIVYIHVVVFFMFILYRNLSKIKDALDLISLDNIDLTLYLK